MYYLEHAFMYDEDYIFLIVIAQNILKIGS